MLNMLVRVITSKLGVGQEVLMAVPSIDLDSKWMTWLTYSGAAYRAECAVENEPLFYVIIVTAIKLHIARLMRLAASCNNNETTPRVPALSGCKLDWLLQGCWFHENPSHCTSMLLVGVA